MDSGSMDVADSKSFLCKTGISGWMKTNFERLNTSENFEAYGSSPPETESYFIARYNKNKLSNLTKETSKISAGENKMMIPDRKYESGLNIHLHQANQHFLVPQVSNLLHENLTDETSSSTDTTPFVTPQGSPMVLRRNLIDSNHDVGKDLLSNNAKKLFYKSYFSDSDMKQADITLNDRIRHRKKCNVSNFDINAISPTSW